MGSGKYLYWFILPFFIASAYGAEYNEIQTKAQDVLERYSFSIKNIETAKHRIADLKKDMELFSGEDRSNIMKLVEGEGRRLSDAMAMADQVIEQTNAIESDMNQFIASDNNLSHVNRIKGVRENLMSQRDKLENLKSDIPKIGAVEPQSLAVKDLEKGQTNEITREIQAEKMEVVSKVEESQPITPAQNITPANFSDQPFMPEAGGIIRELPNDDAQSTTDESMSIKKLDKLPQEAKGESALEDPQARDIVNVSAVEDIELVQQPKVSDAKESTESLMAESIKEPAQDTGISQNEKIAETTIPNGEVMAYVSLNKDVNTYRWYLINAAERGIYEDPNAKFKIVEISDAPTGQYAQMVQQLLIDNGIAQNDLEALTSTQPGINEIRLIRVSADN